MSYPQDQRNLYTFEVDLDESIANELKMIRENCPGAFFYKGQNLESAFFRQLFFELIGNPLFRNAYLTSPGQTIWLRRDIHAGILRSLCGLSRDQVRSQKSLQKRFVHHMILGISSVRSFFARFFHPSEKGKEKRKSCDDTAEQGKRLFFLAGAKFYRFFRNVLSSDTDHETEIIFYCPPDRGKPATEGVRIFSGARALSVFRLSASVPAGFRDFPAILLLFEEICELLRKETPEMVILAEGNTPEDELMSRAASFLGIPVVCVQHGWNPVISCGFRNLSFDLFLTWGSVFSDILKKYSPEQRFVEVGHHGIEASSAINPDKSGKVVSFFMQSPTRFISEDHWNQCLLLTETLARKYRTQTFVVRNHPNYPFSEEERHRLGLLPNIVLSLPEYETLDDLLSRSLIAISVFSTVLLESMIRGVIPLIFNPTPMPRYYPDLEARSCGFEVKTIKEALERMEQLLSDEELRESLLRSAEEQRKSFFIHTGMEAVRSLSGQLKMCRLTTC
ncbi:MAG: hypothetical protein H6618_02825 [Deltaproteobacteria bacterium]|nr:hypothetical protein [Deltaproteobacteria bacterium]